MQPDKPEQPEVPKSAGQAVSPGTATPPTPAPVEPLSEPETTPAPAPSVEPAADPHAEPVKPAPADIPPVPDELAAQLASSEAEAIKPAAAPPEAVAHAGSKDANYVPPAPNTIIEPGSQPNYAPIPRTRHKRRRAMWLALIAVILLAAAAGGYFYLKKQAGPGDGANGSVTLSPKKTTPSTSKVATNVWTGKSGNYNWADEGNWSLGKPSNGQILEFKMEDVKQPSDQYGKIGFSFQNNIRNLTVNKLVFDGQVDSVITGVKGEAFTVTNGIEDTISQTAAGLKMAVPQVDISAAITFDGNQTVHTSGRNILTFNAMNPSDTIAKFNTGTTVQFVSDDDSAVNVMSPISGAGSLSFPQQTAAKHGGYSFSAASPDFTGKVTIANGAMVGIGNHDTKGGYGKTSSFGTAAIEVQSGGTLSLQATGTDSFTLANDLTLSGIGAPSTNKDAGATLGAVSACITKAEEGCSADAKVTLSGKVILNADTQLGASFGLDSKTTPSSTTVTYTIPNLNKNGHALAAVDGSKAAIQ